MLPLNRAKRFASFDYLRVFFCIAIVAWHTKPFGITKLFYPDGLVYYTPTLVDIIYCNIFLMGVPMFMLISLFLYNINRAKKAGYYLTRSRQLILLYVFWTLLFQVLFLGTGTIKNIFSLSTFIPGYGHLYFISCLLILTFCSEVLSQIGNYVSSKTQIIINLVLLVVTLTLIFFQLPLAAFFKNNQYLYLLMGFYSPINFIPYVFISFIIYTWYKSPNFQSECARKIIKALFIALVITIPLEWIYLQSTMTYEYNGMLLAPYARLSLFFACSLVLILFIIQPISTPKWVTKIADLTLGVYLIHYFLLSGSKCALIVVFPELKFLSDTPSLFFFIVLLSSTAITYLFKHERVL